MRSFPYDRVAASAYAERWALGRNPDYYNFDDLGGDCTNFISQCVYAGCGVMNYTLNTGWYYINLNQRAAAWTSVQFFYRFITNNHGAGPYARTIAKTELQPGDVIQLGDGAGQFYHSLFVLSASPAGVYIASHTYDSLWRSLDTYSYKQIRYLHISGVRV